MEREVKGFKYRPKRPSEGSASHTTTAGSQATQTRRQQRQSTGTNTTPGLARAEPNKRRSEGCSNRESKRQKSTATSPSLPSDTQHGGTQGQEEPSSSSDESVVQRKRSGARFQSPSSKSSPGPQSAKQVPTYPQVDYDNQVDFTSDQRTSEARLGEVLDRLLRRELKEVEKVYTGKHAYIAENVTEVANTLINRVEDFLMQGGLQRRKERGSSTAKGTPSSSQDSKYNVELVNQKAVLRKLMENYANELNQWKKIEERCAAPSGESLHSLLDDSESTKSGKASDADYDQQYFNSYSFANDVIQRNKFGEEVADKLSLYSDSIKALFRKAETVTKDAKEATDTAAADLRGKTFRNYSEVDRPSHLVKKLAEKTPEKKNKSSADSPPPKTKDIQGTSNTRNSPRRRDQSAPLKETGGMTGALLASAKQKDNNLFQ
eukprot:gb/GECG01016757.1/.p1 GENE.gb/GECG01016757.1/~~gb/GECG01016757.1/.p1  ORF type:complete len:434 (+),score=73.05 gb/GECG01016757.1/:1-1302(+)